jgi:hypothetical protein
MAGMLPPTLFGLPTVSLGFSTLGMTTNSTYYVLYVPAADNGGVHFGTALTACGIIANNAFNGWFARERDATPEERDWDSVLLGDKFYYFVSNNRDGMIPDLARALTHS